MGDPHSLRRWRYWSRMRDTGLDAHQTRWQLLEECQDIAPLQLTADDHLASAINAVHLKYRLGDVQTDCRNHLHAWLL
jgi:hypothetical protein